MVRTQSDYEMWLFENIHKTMYIILSSALLISIYIIYISFNQLNPQSDGVPGKIYKLSLAQLFFTVSSFLILVT